MSRDPLWAPWRVGFILGPKTPDCFMCTAVSRPPEIETLLLDRTERCFVILNRYPYNNGHLLVGPCRHEGDFTGLDDDELAEIGRLTRHWIGVLRQVMRPDGFNVGWNLGTAAGAGVADHLHQHIVPRWNGDTNFMTICAEQRVINQSLEEAWRLLSAASARRG